MLKVGLSGGYASGKSLVAGELERLGAHIIYADKLGHAVLDPCGDAYQPAVELFGREILGPDGTIDRKKLGSIVFASRKLLDKLNRFVHPAVFRLEERMLQDFASRDPHGIAVIEAAILIETGRYTVFDKLIVTSCSLETQIARAMRRDGLSREEVLARLEKQMPLQEKLRLAHYVINTDGHKEATFRQVRQVFGELKQLSEALN